MRSGSWSSLWFIYWEEKANHLSQLPQSWIHNLNLGEAWGESKDPATHSKCLSPIKTLNVIKFVWSHLSALTLTPLTRNRIEIMKEHAYLAAIDRLLVHSWMCLIRVDDLMSFMSSVRVELLDILHYLQFSIRSDITQPMYKVFILKTVILF